MAGAKTLTSSWLDVTAIDSRLRFILAVSGVVSIGVFPVNHPARLIWYLVAAILIYCNTPGTRVPRTVGGILLSTVLFFGLAPALSSLLGWSDAAVMSELYFGLSVTAKTVAIFFWIYSMIGLPGISRLLLTLKQLRVPDEVLFMLMIAVRYFQRFVYLARQMGEARSLRLHGAPHWRGLSALTSKLAIIAVDHAGAVYQSVLLRGGGVVLPLIPEPTRTPVHGWAGIAGVSVLIIPWLISGVG
ncbi:MAG: energy-coupling factor transporter transmembrane component T [Candidatus Neomarinimicrobiota bacterium]